MKSIKHHFLYIALVMALAVGVVTSLAWIALEPITIKNGFNKQFKPIQVTTIGKIEENEIIKEIIELTDKRIVFKTSRPDQIYITDDSLKNGFVSELPFPNNSWTTPNYTVFINKPNISLFANNSPLLMLSALKTYNTTVKKIPIQLYTKVVPIGSSTYIFRAFDSTRNNDLIFIKYNAETSEIIREKDISEKVEDAGIVTDGHLLYDQCTNSVVFVHLYNNVYKTCDTNLVLKYAGKTIDTTSYVSLKTTLRKEGFKTNSSPTRVINKYATTDCGKLYVLSTLKGDNEQESILKHNFGIEVYDIETGKYDFTFYVPKFQDKAPITFKINKNKVIAIFENAVIAYLLHI